MHEANLPSFLRGMFFFSSLFDLMVLHAAEKKPADYVNEPWLATEEPFQQTINRLLYEIILM